MAVDPYDSGQPSSTSQVELSAELRALKGVNVNHRNKLQVIEDEIVPLAGITPYGTSLLELTNVADNLDLLGAGTAGIQVLEQPTVEGILNLLGLAGATMLIESAGGKTSVTWNTGLMLQIVNLTVSNDGTSFTWLKPFPIQVFGAISGLNSAASQGTSVDTITTLGARADHGNASDQSMTIWALGR